MYITPRELVFDGSMQTHPIPHPFEHRGGRCAFEASWKGKGFV